MTSREKLREQIARLEWEHSTAHLHAEARQNVWEKWKDAYLEQADAILALPDIEVRAENQSLPEMPPFAYDKDDERPLLIRGAINYSKLLTDWVKVIPNPQSASARRGRNEAPPS